MINIHFNSLLSVNTLGPAPSLLVNVFLFQQCCSLCSLEVGQQAMLSFQKVSARLMFMFWEESSILYLTKLLLILCWALLGIAKMLSKLAAPVSVDALSPVFSQCCSAGVQPATGVPVGRRVTPPSLVVVRPTPAA